jgi:hypothetical protein
MYEVAKEAGNIRRYSIEDRDNSSRLITIAFSKTASTSSSFYSALGQHHDRLKSLILQAQRTHTHKEC